MTQKSKSNTPATKDCGRWSLSYGNAGALVDDLKIDNMFVFPVTSLVAPKPIIQCLQELEKHAKVALEEED